MNEHATESLDALTDTPYPGRPEACLEATPARSPSHFQTSQPGTAVEQLPRQLHGALLGLLP